MRPVLVVALALLTLPSQLLAAPASAPATAPNILLLVAEDLSPRVGFAGDPVAHTPTLDALATRSVSFTQTFTAAGVCAPSRAALIMGQHQTSFAAQHMRTTTGPLGPYLARPPAALKALPELLRRAGYYTFTDGKLDYQFSGIRAGSGPFSLWNAEGADTSWRERQPGQPFFGLINFNQTHESGVMSLQGDPLNKAHAMTRAWRSAAGLNAPEITVPADVVLPPYYPDLPAVRRDLARHYDNIRKMDAQVAELLAQLKRDGLAESTIVIWTTDHGDGLPRAKRELFDSGLHVPMLVFFPSALRHLARPGWQPGGTDPRLVSFVDLAPTLLALAGADPQPLHHGQNFLAHNKTRRYLFAARDRIDEVADRQRAIRDARYKYIRSYAPGIAGGHTLAYRDLLGSVRAMRAAWQRGELNPAQSRWFEPAPEFQLYDLQTDPHELNNLAGQRHYRKIQRRLKRALDRRLAEIGDTADTPESQLRANLLTPDGEIPQTRAPQIVQGEQQIEIRAAHDASIGYQLNGEPWQLYTGPIPLAAPPLPAPAHTVIQAKAVRYGYRESRVTELIIKVPRE